MEGPESRCGTVNILEQKKLKIITVNKLEMLFPNHQDEIGGDLSIESSPTPFSFGYGGYWVIANKKDYF